MEENSQDQKSSISKATTPEEISEFWDTHSLADHWDETHEVEFEVTAQRPRRIALDPKLYELLETQARSLGVTPESLANQWLSEHLSSDKAA